MNKISAFEWFLVQTWYGVRACVWWTSDESTLKSGKAILPTYAGTFYGSYTEFAVANIKTRPILQF